jgi:hypothetical protein
MADLHRMMLAAETPEEWAEALMVAVDGLVLFELQSKGFLQRDGTPAVPEWGDAESNKRWLDQHIKQTGEVEALIRRGWRKKPGRPKATLRGEQDAALLRKVARLLDQPLTEALAVQVLQRLLGVKAGDARSRVRRAARFHGLVLAKGRRFGARRMAKTPNV